MSTVRTICTRALRRLGVIDSLHQPSADEMATAKDGLEEMLSQWRTHGVDVMAYSFGLDDVLTFFVPPLSLTSEVIASAVLAGAWDAATNTPALASAVGTKGAAYRVGTAGSTTLDGIASWAVGDYAVYDGAAWLKGRSADRHDGAVIALLAVRIAGEFGSAAPDQVRIDARDGWSALQSCYVKPPVASFDRALISMPSRTMTTSWSEQ